MKKDMYFQKGASAIFILTALLAGLIVGVVSVGFMTKSVVEEVSIKNGAWLHNPYVGSNEASGYTRAAVAMIGFLGMRKEESIYFLAREDDTGASLNGSCTYKVSGMFDASQARWWSITAYNALTSKLIPNDENRYSYNGDTIQLNEDGSFSFYVAPEEKPGNWIPVQADMLFDLTLRLYNAPEVVRENVEALALPTITREGCL